MRYEKARAEVRSCPYQAGRYSVWLLLSHKSGVVSEIRLSIEQDISEAELTAKTATHVTGLVGLDILA